MRRPLVLLVLGLAALVAAACGAADAEPATSDEAEGAGERPGVVRVDADAAVEILDERDDVTIIDVRTPEEFAAGHLDGAELVDIYEPSFRDEVNGFDRDASYVLYCRTGNRSGQAAALMQELGFAEVYDAGALDDLDDAGATVVR